MNMAILEDRAVKAEGRASRPRRYTPPSNVNQSTLQTLLAASNLPPMAAKQLSLLGGNAKDTHADIPLWCAGDQAVLNAPSIAIVGARAVSENGAKRARRIARQLAESGVTIVSGLAMGVDTVALSSAIEAGGKVTAVLGTPLSKATPVDNSELQMLIYSKHLLISQFAEGDTIHKANFPKRNRTMAALSRGTLIVEASDTSGTLHQAAECTQLKRWLFVLKSVMENPEVTWPAKFQASYERFVVVESVNDILPRVQVGCS